MSPSQSAADVDVKITWLFMSYSKQVMLKKYSRGIFTSEPGAHLMEAPGAFPQKNVQDLVKMMNVIFRE